MQARTTYFADRRDAGRRLGALLTGMPLHDPVVLALPRGGVPVAAEVARALGAPWEVFVARKVGAPGHEEYGIGAVAEGVDGDDEVVLTPDVGRLRLRPEEVGALVARQRAELARRVRRYRADRALPEVAARDVLLVDDGLATGVTAEAALRALRRRAPRRLVLAVPVCAPEARCRLEDVADAVVCVTSPARFLAVGAWYEDFGQTTDEEVLDLLVQATPAPGD